MAAIKAGARSRSARAGLSHVVYGLFVDPPLQERRALKRPWPPDKNDVNGAAAARVN